MVLTQRGVTNASAHVHTDIQAAPDIDIHRLLLSLQVL